MQLDLLFSCSQNCLSASARQIRPRTFGYPLVDEFIEQMPGLMLIMMELG